MAAVLQKCPWHLHIPVWHDLFRGFCCRDGGGLCVYLAEGAGRKSRSWGAVVLFLSLLHEGKQDQELGFKGVWCCYLQTGRTSPPWLGKAVGCVLHEACSVWLALHHVQQGNQLALLLDKDGRCSGISPGADCLFQAWAACL